MENLSDVLVPVIAVIIIIAVIFLFNKKSDQSGQHYDEMQLKYRAQGYKIGFFVTLGGIFLLVFLTDVVDSFRDVIPLSFCMAAVGFAGLVSFVVYCIFKDAFYSIGQKRRSYIILCILIIVLNGLGAVRNMQEKTLSFANNGNLLCAVSFLIILVSLIIKGILEKREEVAE